MEIWKLVLIGILSVPSGYEVSDQGRIRNLKGKVLKPWRCPTRKGLYLKVDIWVTGKRYQRFIHRLVALAFVENPHGKPEVNHENNIMTDNRASNLSWMTRKEQEAHKRFFEHQVLAEAVDAC